MKGLLIKDWYMILKRGRFFLVFNILYSVLAVYANTPAFFVLFNVMINCMMVKTLMAFEEQNRWSSLCINLPVKASCIVWEKYIVGISCALLANVISNTVIKAAQLMGNFDPQLQVFPMFLLYMAVALLYLAIELPVLFKFGVNEGRIWFTMATALVAALGAGTGNMLVDRIGRIAVLPGNSLTAVMGILVAVGAAAIYISGKLSVRIYNKKEL